MMKHYWPWQDSSNLNNPERPQPQPQLQIPLAPPDWYLEKLEKEREEKRTPSYEVDYTIRDNDRCVIIKDI